MKTNNPDTQKQTTWEERFKKEFPDPLWDKQSEWKAGNWIEKFISDEI